MGNSVLGLQHIVVAEADYIQNCFHNYFDHHQFELYPENHPRDGRNLDLGLDCRSHHALDPFHVLDRESLLQNLHLVRHDGPDLVVLFLELSGLLLIVLQVVNHLLVGRFLRFVCWRKI